MASNLQLSIQFKLKIVEMFGLSIR